MSENKHTPEPWYVATGDDYYIEAKGIPAKYPHHFKGDDLGKHVAIVGNRTSDFGEANARRIVACVNACAGVDTECLEAAPIGIFASKYGTPGYIDQLEKQRDELLAALEAILDRVPNLGKINPLYQAASAAIASVKGGA